MAGAPGGLSATIRQKLHDGKTPDEVVQDLVAGGLTKVSAQRFVDRVLAEQDPVAPLPPITDAPAVEGDSLDQFIQTKAVETQEAAAKTGRASLWVASSLMCGGILITAISFMMAGPNDRFTLMWGPVVFGFFLWGKTVVQGFANARTFAWFSAIGAILAPVVLTVLLLGAAVATAPTEDEETAAVDIAGTIEPGSSASAELPPDR